MKLFAAAALAALGAAVSGCATVIEGTTQSVSVTTTPATGAQCTLTNSQGTWFVNSPGSVVVHKTKTDLDVTCQKNGFQPGHVVAASHFGGATAANVFGGVGGVVIGGAVDAASGANYSYDSPIVVSLGSRIPGIAVASDQPPPSFPVSLQCAAPAVAAVFIPDGPAGYVTATINVDVNSVATADAVSATPAQDAVCTLSAIQNVAIRSASFDIASSWTADGKPFTDHVDIIETAPGQSHGPAYTFTVKARDNTESRLTLKFPVNYH